MERLAQKKGMIFDLDGTLLDSMWIWDEVDRRFLAKRGIALPPDYMEAVNALEFSSGGPANRPIEEILRSCGAKAALMTGSGAAVFGVFTQREAADEAKARLLRHYPRAWVVRPVARGAHVVESN